MNELELFRQEATARMDQHDVRLNAGDEKFDQISAKLDALIQNTDPIVKFLNDAQATGRMADRFRQLAWWMLRFGILAGGVLAYWEMFKIYFKSFFGGTQ